MSCIIGLAIPSTAQALEPLSAFVDRARTASPSNREAAATSRQRGAEARVAGAALLPSFDARGTYTHNEYETILALPSADGGPGQSVTVQPLNQFDASFKLAVPLIDVGGWEKRSAARSTEDAAQANQVAVGLEVERLVTRSYYQLLGAEALLASARGALAVAVKSADEVQVRKASEVATELDVQRARAQVASSQQDVANAEYQVSAGRRRLGSLTGLDPSPATEFIADDLHEEAPLRSFLGGGVDELPGVASAVATRRATEKSLGAARLAWAPTLSGALEERLTNASGFSGESAYYVATLTASWHFDFGVPATVQVRAAASEAAQAREQQARLDASDAIFDAWHQIRANIEKARAARAQLSAARLAEELAQSRYENGVATQLDVLQAQRDAFQADVSRIQSDTDLAYARVALRLSARRAATTPTESP